MSFIELLLIAVSMSMDAFAVSICKGLSVGKVTPKQCLAVGGWFGGFQGMMPVIGFVLTSLFAALITSISHCTDECRLRSRAVQSRQKIKYT